MSASPSLELSENPEIPKTLVGALFLLLQELLPSLPTSAASMFQVLGVGKSQCYELKKRLRKALPELLQRPGRPPAIADPVAESAVVKACYDYVVTHPGSVCVNRSRRRYSPEFRVFVVELLAPGGPAEGMNLDSFARATNVPSGTLKDWLTISTTEADPATEQGQSEVQPATEAGTTNTLDISVLDSIRDARIRTILSQWPAWKGTFHAFCLAMSSEFAIPFGPTFIGNLLQAVGLRDRKLRVAKEKSDSNQVFRTFFPGAQWLGDGTALGMNWNGRLEIFNVEPLLDTASDAVVGFAVTDTEDAEALRQAYDASLETTEGVVPWAVTLDNKACNTCDAAAAALEDAIILYGTPGRGQSKAALEGAFGLFAQTMPALEICGRSSREMARSALQIILTAWFRGRNGRPRKRFNGRTPAQVFLEGEASPEEIAEFKKWIEELQRRQEAIRLTREARLDPERIRLAKDGLASLDIADPDDRLAKRLASYSRDSITIGVATFKSKRELGTLPQELYNDGAYLHGIIRNTHTRLELEKIEVHLLEQRLRAADLRLEPLSRTVEQLRAQVSPEKLEQGKLVKDFLRQALHARYKIDFLFWAKATTDAFLSLTPPKRAAIYKSLIRRITAASKVHKNRRLDLIDRLVKCLVLTTVSVA